MNYFVRGRVTSGQSTFDVHFEKPKNAIILCKDYPDFFVTIDLRNISNFIINSSMTSIDARFIEDETIRIDSDEDLSFWIEIDIQWMLEECEKYLLRL